MGKSRGSINFSSKAAEANYMRAIHSIPDKNNPSKSVADATPGNQKVTINGHAAKVSHKK